ncbi:MAG TPA: HAD-IIIA family hydrolase [Polyangiaceae bacterium]|nr:HAD-IIIA family hydrolase [Polyangiaceae bacterium]HYQ26376.1 HAD-IIIA family hydrolase [Polyangiaceae bacterium]
MIDPQLELIIFDADGTLRYVTVPGQHYPLRANEWRLMPNVPETLRALPRSRLKFGIASNQHGVALGLLTQAEAQALLLSTWHSAWASLAPSVLIEMCVCLPDAPCIRRKPEPGMLQSLIRRYGVPPERALYVGDLPIDRDAAERAHVRFSWAQEFFAPKPASELLLAQHEKSDPDRNPK